MHLAVKAGVIGVGYLGQHHARIYNELEGVELAAVVDTDYGRAEEISSAYGSKPYTDYREALRGLDAVSIVTPTTEHFRIAMDCVEAGIDMLIEKPITVTVKEADELIEAAESKGRLIQVGHLERYNPAVVKVDGLIKDLEFVESERVSPFIGRGIDVDVTHDLMIHDIDIIISLVGDSAIKDIRVVGAKVMTEHIDVAKAWLEFENGITALITASRISKAKKRRLRLYQRDSLIELDYQARQILVHRKTPEGAIASESIRVEDREPLRDELADFMGCVVSRRRPRVSGVEGREALRVARRISRKIRGVEAHR